MGQDMEMGWHMEGVDGRQLHAGLRWLKARELSLSCLLLGIWLGLVGHIFAGEPLKLHPDNPHYFLWRGKPTVLIGSGEHYGALLNLDFDFERYFAALARDGLNHTRTFSGTYREVPGSFGITDNTLAPKPGRYLAPWARSDEPGYYDGGNKFDLKRFDSKYFERLKRFMATASKYGVVVEFNLFCPLYNEELWLASPMNSRNNVNGIGNCPRDEVLTLKHPDLVEVQLAFVRRVVEELNEFDNFYLEVCNEPYARNVPWDWQEKIIETIVETERNLPNKHLISLNIANGSKKVEKVHPAVSILNFHYCTPPDAVGWNYHWNCVIGENETGFRGREDIIYRTEAWEFILAGGGLFSHLDYSFTCTHPEGTFRDYSSPGGGSPELRQQLGILKRFMESFDFVRMRPFPEALHKKPGDLNVRILADPGRAYAVYLCVPIPRKPKNLKEHLRANIRAELELRLPPGSYQGEWISPISGEVVQTVTIDSQGEVVKVQTPVFSTTILPLGWCG